MLVKVDRVSIECTDGKRQDVLVQAAALSGHIRETLLLLGEGNTFRAYILLVTSVLYICCFAPSVVMVERVVQNTYTSGLVPTRSSLVQ
jgi:hypothetical protein